MSHADLDAQYFGKPTDTEKNSDRALCLESALDGVRADVEFFKRQWQQIPNFADRVNQTTRGKIHAATNIVFNIPTRINATLALVQELTQDAPTDTEMLDFLIKNDAMVGRSNCGEVSYWISQPNKPGMNFIGNHATARDAISAAIKTMKGSPK